jgi:glycosyltransferase involved in cell wall biosynthesis
MNTKKKILFLVTQSEFGGAQRFIYTLIHGLSLASSYDIMVASGTEGDDKNGLLNLLNKEGIKTERLKYLKRSVNPFFDLLGLFEIKRLLRKEKPDILFLCSSKAGFLGSLATATNSKSQILNPKIIYRIGGWTFNDPWSEWKKKLYICLEKFSAKWKDYIVNNAESDRQQAIKLGIKPKKEILVIYNGIDVNKLDFLPREEARQKIMQICGCNADLQIADNQQSALSAQNQHIRIMVGTIANDYPAKGLKYLREAEKKLPNIKFVILSGIPNAHKYLRAFDVFILPSVKEGFPWVILEAMGAEIPVIATRVGALPEIIGSGENGLLIEPKRPDQIVEAIEELLKNEGLKNKLVINAKKTIEEKFNLNQMINRYIELFESTN